MERGIYIPANTKYPVRALNYDDINDAASIAKDIGAGLVERVRIGDFREDPPKSLAPAIMLVDEEGLLRNRPINLRASVLYGATKHGNMIYGHVVLVQEDMRYTSEGPDIYWGGFSDADAYMAQLEEIFRGQLKMYNTPAPH